MGPIAKAGLLVAMVALMVAGQLLEREFAGRRAAGRRPSLAYAELLEPLPDATLPRPRPGAPRGSAQAPAAGVAAGERWYVVRPGDTLAKIARKVYGSEREWKRIYDANRSVIPDPARLQPGAKLRITPREPNVGR